MTLETTITAIQARIAKHEELARRWRDLLSLLDIDLSSNTLGNLDARPPAGDAGTAVQKIHKHGV